jgi:hypothetical protein
MALPTDCGLFSPKGVRRPPGSESGLRIDFSSSGFFRAHHELISILYSVDVTFCKEMKEEELTATLWYRSSLAK